MWYIVVRIHQTVNQIAIIIHLDSFPYLFIGDTILFQRIQFADHQCPAEVSTILGIFIPLLQVERLEGFALQNGRFKLLDADQIAQTSRARVLPFLLRVDGVQVNGAFWIIVFVQKSTPFGLPVCQVTVKHAVAVVEIIGDTINKVTNQLAIIKKVAARIHRHPKIDVSGGAELFHAFFPLADIDTILVVFIEIVAIVVPDR